MFGFLFDNIINSPEKVVESLYEFLGIDSSYKPSIFNKKINQSLIPLSTAFSNFQRSTTKTVRNLGLGSLVEFGKNIGLKRAIQIINSNDSFELNILSNDTKDYLTEFFRDDVKKLSSLLKIDLSRIWLQSRVENC